LSSSAAAIVQYINNTQNNLAKIRQLY